MARAVVALTAAAVMVAACGGTNYRYVQSSANNTYFKVPTSWKVYGKAQILGANDQPISREAEAGLRFLTVFDGDPAPSLKHDFRTARYPFGLVRVRTLTPEERDQYSLASIRNEVFGLDDLRKTDPNAVEPLEQPKAITRPGGLHGTHLVYTVRGDSSTFSVDQTGLVDTDTRQVYFIIVGCESHCFTEHRRVIDEVAKSWTIKEH